MNSSVKMKKSQLLGKWFSYWYLCT